MFRVRLLSQFEIWLKRYQDAVGKVVVVVAAEATVQIAVNQRTPH